MVAKFLDLSKPWFCKYMYGRKKTKKKKTDMYDFPEHDCPEDKMVAHFFLSSYDNGRLCEERLLRSINFAAMVM